jgi:hypothetical protein
MDAHARTLSPSRSGRRWLLAAPLALAVVALGAASASAMHISISAGDDALDIQHDDVVIRGDDHTRARITPEGQLIVDGHRVRLSRGDRQAFAHYNAALHRIEDRAISLGLQGAGLAFSAIGEAVLAVASGDGHRAERRVEARADRMKDEARELCAEVRTVQRIQDALAATVPEFEPYAVLDMDDDDCRVED